MIWAYRAGPTGTVGADARADVEGACVQAARDGSALAVVAREGVDEVQRRRRRLVRWRGCSRQPNRRACR